MSNATCDSVRRLVSLGIKSKDVVRCIKEMRQGNIIVVTDHPPAFYPGELCLDICVPELSFREIMESVGILRAEVP